MAAPTSALSAKVLIVDDQESNLRLLEHTLRRAGYVAVTSTGDPCTVAALHRENRYDLIMLDLQMPRMNGFDVMKDLAQAEGVDRVAILVLSADPSLMIRAMEAGASGFLSKPFALPEVLVRIQFILKKTVSPELKEPALPVATANDVSRFHA